jgi:hypothetical protein
MISSLLNRPCTLLIRASTGEDDYGNATVTETTLPAVCAFQRQAATGENESQNNLADSICDLFLPAGSDVSSGDGVIVDGLEYEVDGDPWPVRNERTGEFSHVEVRCRRVSGAEDAS